MEAMPASAASSSMLIHDAAWSPPCAETTLGACQPAGGTVASCRSLCMNTLGCVGYTFILPGAALKWDRACINPKLLSHKALANVTVAGRCCLEASLPRHPRLVGKESNRIHGVAGELEPSAFCRRNCRMPWPMPSQLDNVPPKKIDVQVRSHHGSTVSTRVVPWVEIAQTVEQKVKRRPEQAEAAATTNTAAKPPQPVQHEQHEQRRR